MDFSDAKATFGLACIGSPISPGSSGSLQIGTYQQSVSLTEVDVGYVVRAILPDSSSTLSLNVLTGDTSGSDAWVAGVAQVETATIVAASGCTSNGTMTLVVTADGLTGSPLNVAVPITTAVETTAALIATAARTALAADTAVAALFTVGGTGADITLTRLPTKTFTVPTGTLNIYAANDTTLNIAIPSGLGVTAAPSSTNTTAGVLTTGAKIYGGDGLDAEGEALPASTKIRAVKLYVETATDTADAIDWTSSGTVSVSPGETLQRARSTNYGLDIGTTNTFVPQTGPLDMTVSIFGVQ